MTNSDYIEVKGPTSLAELVAVIDPSAPRPDEDLVTLELGGDEYPAVQCDEVDKDSWPYMITIESDPRMRHRSGPRPSGFWRK